MPYRTFQSNMKHAYYNLRKNILYKYFSYQYTKYICNHPIIEITNENRYSSFSRGHRIILTQTTDKSKQCYIHSRCQNRDFAKPLLWAGCCCVWDCSSHYHCQCRLHQPLAHSRTQQQGGMLFSSCLWTSTALRQSSRRETCQRCLTGNLQGKESVTILCENQVDKFLLNYH